MRGRNFASSLFIIVMVILLAGFLHDAIGADWIYYGTDAEGNKEYYDRKSIHNVSKGVIKVWTKHIFSEAGRANAVNVFRESAGVDIAEYEALEESIDLYMLNCADEKYKIVQGSLYANDGRILASFKNDITPWSEVVPDSMLDTLMKTICKKMKRTK